MQYPSAGKKAARPIFLHLKDLLSHYGRVAPRRHAILAPGYAPVTYGELYARVNDVVLGLRELGVGPRDRVAVVLSHGPDAAVAIIAVATAAICVPLNPSFTVDELHRYFSDLQLAALLTHPNMVSAGRSAAHALGMPVIDLSPWPSEGPDAFKLIGSGTRRAVSGELPPSADNDAFILLTSGTTSRPKMVPLTHASVCLSAHNAGSVLELAPRDRLLNVLPLFHAHGLISGLLTALAAGSTVVCTPQFDPAAFFDWLTEFQPTWYTAVPAIHRAVLSAADHHKHSVQGCSLRVIRSASATLPPAVLRELEAVFGVPVIETYGMTEAASQIAANPMRRGKPGSVGKPAGAEIAIMDGEGRLLGVGERGEIALRGPTITSGYDNDIAATQSAFRDGWFLTGDLGYLDRDGYLFIVGRIKDVIKRGGQQVAPAEVEEALLGHPDVLEAAAFSIPHERLNEDVAAAVVLRPSAKLSTQELRSFARERLAMFKVPSLICIVNEIPKTPGGKIRRGELAAALSMTLPRARMERSGKLVSPRSELECQLAKIWAKLLELNQISIDEDVFALGADSITVTQMLLHLKADFGVDFSFEDIFEAPTVETLAARVASWERHLTPAPNVCDPLTEFARGQRGAPPAVSIVQEYMLRIEREFPGLPQFNLPFAYRLQGPLNVPALAQSLAEVVRWHDSLRTGFAWVDGLPVAHIAPAAGISSSLVVEDIAAEPRTGNDRAKTLLLKKVELEAERATLIPFNLGHPPLFRMRLFRLGADDHFLLFIVHHIIIDGWSMGILIDEVSELYAGFAAGRPPQLAEAELQFSDFARWQCQWCASPATAQHFAYWKERLREISPIFPTNDRRKRAMLAPRISQKILHLEEDLVARLSALSHNRGATLFMTLLAGLKTLLLARCGRDDICIATAMANRSQRSTERVIGPFENTVLIRTQLNADLSFHDALSRVRDSVLGAYARQQLPFGILVRRLTEEDGLDPASLIQVFFLLQNAFRPLKLPKVAAQAFAYPEGQPVMPIDRTCFTMIVQRAPSGLLGACSCKHDLIPRNTLQHWIADYKIILTRAAANPETSIGHLAESCE